MLKLGSAGSIAVLSAALVGVLPGCGPSPATMPGRDDPRGTRDSAAAAAPAKAPAPGGMALGEEALSEHGFIPLWTKSPTEGAFQNVYLLPEGIFAVVRPVANSTAWRLIRYKLDDGLPMWIYDLDEPLRFAPVAYHYGPSDQARANELYILQKDVVRCLDLQYGAEMWRIPLQFPVSCGPVVDETQYYLGSLNGRIYAMPKNKPYEAWQHISGGEIKSPGTLGANREVYFTSVDKTVYRLESASGWLAGKSWSFATGGRIFGSPVFFSRWIFVGSTDFKLYSFETDGTHAWEFPAESAILTTPTVMSLRPDKPLVICTSRDDRRGQEKNMMWTLDAKTGEMLWQKENMERAIGIGRRAVYVLKEQGGKRIIAFDALKGEELASLPVGAFDYIPTNDADHGTNPKARGIIYLISKTGFMQAIREKP